MADRRGFPTDRLATPTGELHVIGDLPVATLGSDFQRAVWTELCRIPPGETIPYGEMARRVGVIGAYGWLLSHESRAGRTPELPF